jgi:hypothetical protein
MNPVLNRPSTTPFGGSLQELALARAHENVAREANLTGARLPPLEAP